MSHTERKLRTCGDTEDRIHCMSHAERAILSAHTPQNLHQHLDEGFASLLSVAL